MIKERLSPDTKQKLIRMRQRLAVGKERVVAGGRRREQLLLKLLKQHYDSMFKRQWQLGGEEPHFFSHHQGLFGFTYGEKATGPYAYYRGFFNSEVIGKNDRLFDIGCGDGFFTKRFFSEPCSHIDAIDIEPSAIEEAQTRNASANITYRLLDAVNEAFPAEQYDVIVWDAALGHFAPDTTHRMLGKIAAGLAPEGIFVGSESLGVEGADHLQFFHSLSELQALFKPYFKHVELRAVEYKVGPDNFFGRKASGIALTIHGVYRSAAGTYIQRIKIVSQFSTVQGSGIV